MLFSFNVIQHINLFLSLKTGMERLEEYAEDESPFTKQENIQRDPIQET